MSQRKEQKYATEKSVVVNFWFGSGVPDRLRENKAENVISDLVFLSVFQAFQFLRVEVFPKLN